MKLHWNFSQRAQPSHSIGPKTYVLECFWPFHYCTKVDAKLAEQVPLTHKFAKWSCVEFFRNERTWSTALELKLMFWGVSDRFVTTRSSMHMFAEKSCVGTFRNERTWSAPLDPKLIFWDFLTISLRHESRRKTCRTGAINAQVR
jgi:hypothetical protein